MRQLSKLSHYGIKGSLLKFFESFLTGHTQFIIKYGGARSANTRSPQEGSFLAAPESPIENTFHTANFSLENHERYGGTYFPPRRQAA
jgi:hypothetical protein